MNRLKISIGANPKKAFDIALDAAHNRTRISGKNDEQYFVRELISETTLRQLNTAAANSYDENYNIVRFSGAFIHGRPYAEFIASTGVTTKSCRRELADAIVVLNETQQDGTGLHEVVRSVACMLMFKKSDDISPKCNSYNPHGGELPNGTDQEQFYLFNRWPLFNLLSSVRTPIKGKGSYALAVNGVAPRNVGKYSVLWSPNPQLNCCWGSLWRFSDPLPSSSINDSLGDLLARMADADATIGAPYDSRTPKSDWDHLIVDLHAYADTHHWLGGRLANPAGIGFLEAREVVEANVGTLRQRKMRSDLISGLLLMNDPWEDHFYPSGPAFAQFLDSGEEITPILCVTVSSFINKENAESQNDLTNGDAARNALIAINRVGFKL